MPTYRTSWSGTSVSATTFAVTLTGFTAQDIALAILSTDGTITTTPTGWAKLGPNLNYTGAGTVAVNVAIYAKLLLPTDTTITFTFTGASHSCAAIAAYSAASTSPGGIYKFAAGLSAVDGSTLTAPSITTAENGDQIIELWAVRSALATTLTLPATSRVTVAAAVDMAAGISDQAQASAGATGTQTATALVTGSWVAFTVALLTTPAASTYPPGSNTATASAPYSTAWPPASYVAVLSPAIPYPTAIGQLFPLGANN